MRLRTSSFIASLSLASSALAFRDTSPFVAFTTSSSLGDLTSSSSISIDTHGSVAHSKGLSDHLDLLFSSCSSDAYVIVSQPGISSSDLQGSNAPAHLKRRIRDAEDRIGKMNERLDPLIAIENVIGAPLDAQKMKSRLESTCSVRSRNIEGTDLGNVRVEGDAYPMVLTVDFPSLDGLENDERSRRYALHDSHLNALLTSLHPHSCTVVYTTTPRSTSPSPSHLETAEEQHPLYDYEPSDSAAYPNAQHVNLRRDHSSHGNSYHAHMVRDDKDKPASPGNNTNAPLFERYNYFSPGLFMGFIAVFLLLTILYIALQAISSVQIPEGAFAKEMVQSLSKVQKQQ